MFYGQSLCSRFLLYDPLVLSVSPQLSVSASLLSSDPHPSYYYPLHPPGRMYCSPRHDMQYSPVTHYQANSGGWHPHPYSYGNPSYHPPGLPVPPPPLPLAPPVPQSRTEEITAASSFTDIFQLDEFWRGRLAPLPGYQSRPGLVPLKERKRIQIDVPTLPFSAKNYQKNALPTFTNNDTEVSFCNTCS